MWCLGAAEHSRCIIHSWIIYGFAGNPKQDKIAAIQVGGYEGMKEDSKYCIKDV